MQQRKTIDQILDEWIMQCCELRGHTAFRALFDSYKAFAAARGYPTLTERQFALKLPFPRFLPGQGKQHRSGVTLLQENNNVA